MKKNMRFILCVVLAAFLLGISIHSIVYAHAGGPPYVKVNGIYAQTNPILNTSAPVTFMVGADVASSSGIIVGKEVRFEVDEKYFPNPYAQAQSPFGMPVVNQGPPPAAEFLWDFKDGSAKEEGNTRTHVYKKPGTYIVELSAKFSGKTTEFAPVDTIQMTVVPTESYQLPQAVITINGEKIEDALRDTVSIKPMTFVDFSGTASTGNIRSYQWDFGDEKGSDKKITRHRYSREDYFPTVSLRVIDEHNIISDTYALVDLPFQKSNPVMAIYYKIADFVVSLFQKE